MSLDVGEKNIISQPLVDREKIVFSPLHIKLGLMKQYVKALDLQGDCFHYICGKFPRLSYEKIKTGVFDGQQIRTLIRDPHFTNSERNWERGLDFIRDSNMCIKVHFLYSHLDRFPKNLGAVSDEQGERFHQDLKTWKIGTKEDGIPTS